MIVTTTARASALASAGQSENPFVMFANLAQTATLGGTAALADGAAANAVTGTTYDYWRPNVVGATCGLSADFGTATALSCAAIAAHNLATFAAGVKVQRSADGATWTDVTDYHTPTDNSPIVFRFVSASHRYWRILINGLSTGNAIAVGVFSLGNEWVFEQRLYQGHAPRLAANIVDLQSNVSEGGNLLGSSVVRNGSQVQVDITYLTPGFVRSATGLAFIDHFNRGKGFFWGWRPLTYAQDVNYCWRSGGVIAPANTGPRDFMGMGWTARVYEHG